MIFFKKHKKRVSLVLSGGGAKGFFHCGVIDALRDSDIEIDEISGTSVGAIVGTIFASNPDFDFYDVLNDINLLKFIGLAFTRGDEKAIKRIGDLLKKSIKVSNFNELKIPMSFNAVDIKTGEEIIFRKGDIFPGVIASMAIPFIFPSVHINGRYLADGGLANNLPISLIRNHRDKIVASNLNSPLITIKDTNDTTNVLMNSFYIIQKNSVDRSLEIARKIEKKNILEIELSKYFFTLDFRKNNMQELMNLGYKEAMAKIKKL